LPTQAAVQCAALGQEPSATQEPVTRPRAAGDCIGMGL